MCPHVMMYVTLLLLTTAQCYDVQQAMRHVNEILDKAQSYDVIIPRVINSDTTQRGKRSMDDVTMDTTQHVDEIERNDDVIMDTTQHVDEIDKKNKKVIVIGDWLLDTETNPGIVFSDGFTAEWVDNVDQSAAVNDVTGCQLRRGEIRGERESLVAITVCEGDVMMGFIQARRGYYFLQPIEGGFDLNTHVLYKAKDSLMDDLRGDEHRDSDGVREREEEGGNEQDERGHSKEAHRSKRESYLSHNTTELHLKMSPLDNSQVYVSHVYGAVMGGSAGKQVYGAVTGGSAGKQVYGAVTGGSAGKQVYGTVMGQDKHVHGTVTGKHRGWGQDQEEDDVGYFVDTTWEKYPTIRVSQRLRTSSAPQTIIRLHDF